MGAFDMAQSVVAQAAGIINSDASIDISSVMTDLEPRLMEMELAKVSSDAARFKKDSWK